MNVKVNGEKLREIRRRKAMERTDLSERSGVHWTTIARIELGRTPTTRASTARKIADALAVDPQEFVGEEVVTAS